jgi:hypothetical protein
VLAPKPRLFKVLAVVCLLSATLGILEAFDSFSAAFTPRDRWKEMRRTAELLLVAPPDPKTTEDTPKLVERRADIVYARRYAALTLGVINLILSGLLFAGCARALAGQPWGLSAWSVAAAASIPYRLLESAYLMVLVRDLSAVESSSQAALATVVVPTQMVLVVLFYGACLVYLRRPKLRALFER